MYQIMVAPQNDHRGSFTSSTGSAISSLSKRKSRAGNDANTTKQRDIADNEGKLWIVWPFSLPDPLPSEHCFRLWTVHRGVRTTSRACGDAQTIPALTLLNVTTLGISFSHSLFAHFLYGLSAIGCLAKKLIGSPVIRLLRNDG
jgi:hypothetical protein